MTTRKKKQQRKRLAFSNKAEKENIRKKLLTKKKLSKFLFLFFFSTKMCFTNHPTKYYCTVLCDYVTDKMLSCIQNTQAFLFSFCALRFSTLY